LKPLQAIFIILYLIFSAHTVDQDLNKQAQKSYLNNNLDSAFIFINFSIKEREEKKDQIGLAYDLTIRALFYEKQNKLNSALSDINQALTIYKAVNKPIDLSKTYNKQSYIYRRMGLLDSAIIACDRALNLAKIANDKKLVAITLTEKSIAHQMKGEVTESAELITQSISILESINDTNSLSNAYLSMGLMNKLDNNLSEAIKNIQKSLELSLKLGQSTKILNAHINLGETFILIESYDMAEKHLFKAVDMLGKSNQKNVRASVYCDLGKLNIKRKRLAEAEKYAKMALQINEELNEEFSKIYDYINLGQIELLKKNGATARSFFEQAMDLSNKFSTTSESNDIYEGIYKSYSIEENYKSALEWHEKLLALINSQKKSQKSEAIAEIKTRYEVEKKDAQIKLLNKNNEIAELEAEKRASQTEFLIGIFIATLSILAIVLFFLQKLNKSNQKLLLQKSEIENQRNQIENQKEILMALNHKKDQILTIISHDLRNPMIAVKGVLDFYKNGLLEKEEIENIAVSLNNNISTIDETLLGLLQWAKEDTLTTTAEKTKVNVFNKVNESFVLLQEMARMKGIKFLNQCNVVHHILISPIHLNIIIRNLLTNATKFSYPSGKIIVSSAELNQKIQISVKDFGVGVKDDLKENLFITSLEETNSGTNGEKGSGIGLYLCKEFVEKNNGKIWIENNPEGGSVFFIEFPVA